jgi:opacity protein-like surface antigen
MLITRKLRNENLATGRPMKKTTLRLLAFIFLIASPAFAADMAVKAPPPPASAPFSWTGFYAGIAGGLAWGQSQFIDADPANLNSETGLPITNRFDVSGGIFGGTVGYDRQLNNWVAGVEGDLSWVDQHGTSNSMPPFNTVGSNTTRAHWLGTGRMRLGVIPADRWFVYANRRICRGGSRGNLQWQHHQGRQPCRDPNALGLDCRRRGRNGVVSEFVVQARMSLCRFTGQELLSSSHSAARLPSRQTQRHFERQYFAGRA